MTMQAMPSRAQIDAAEPLEFASPPRISARTERQATITIEVAPDGLHVRCEYVSGLSSIPAAIERLKAAGVLQLVAQSRPTPPAPLTVAPATIRQPQPRKAERVEPWYDSRGEACCPSHRKPLQEGQYGLYCPSRASRDEPQNAKGYCNLTFSD